MKKIVAYSSVAHMNFAVLGMFAFNFYGFLGSLALMLSHGLVSGGLFLSVGFLYDRYKTRLLIYYGGLVRLMPIYTLCFFILILANMSFPGTFSFIGEFVIFLGLISENYFICLLSGLTMIFSAAYSLMLYTNIVYGSLKISVIRKFADLSKREFFMVFLLVFLTILFGIAPGFIFDYLEVFVPNYLDYIFSFYRFK
jgi:NADH:ubiquinone oxidoreductase subunit 4 (subunit M)